MFARKKILSDFAKLILAEYIRDDHSKNVSNITPPEKLYHATYEPLVESIKKYGLIPDSPFSAWGWEVDKAVYLATDKDIAESYAEIAENAPEGYLESIIVFEVKTKDLDLKKLKSDPNVSNVEGETTTFAYYGKIPFSKLKQV